MRFSRIPHKLFLLGPFAIITIGFLLNAFVMAKNGGTMPVLWPGGCDAMPVDEIHSCMTHATHWKFLADWINVPNGVASPGDFFIWAYQYSIIPSLVAWVLLVWRDYEDGVRF